MNLIAKFDGSVSAAPAAFKTAVDYVVHLFDKLFTNDVTVTIHVGWGEVAGQKLDPDAGGESIQTAARLFNYTQIRNALIKTADATGISYLEDGAATIPVANPTTSNRWDLGTAEAKALGLINPGGTQVDGYVGFDKTSNWSYSPTVKPGANQEDIIGDLEHEFSEIMGRTSDEGTNDGFANEYTPMDLFRYHSPGVRSLHPAGAGSTSYFSLDRGNTNLGSWNNQVANGDLGDWYPRGPAGNSDAFNDYGNDGTLSSLSARDVALMNILGWKGPAAPFVA